MRRLTNESRDSRNSNAVRIYCDVETALDRLYKLEDIINECHIDSLEELKVRLKQSQSKIRTPELEDRYFFIQSTGQVRNCFNTTQNRKNKGRIEMGNYFDRKADAERMVNYTKYTNLLRKYIEEFDNIELDWEDPSQNKYYIYYNHHLQQLDYEIANGVQTAGVLYASNSKVLADAVKFAGEENVLKYIFEV